MAVILRASLRVGKFMEPAPCLFGIIYRP
jgi:hypothetical protein